MSATVIATQRAAYHEAAHAVVAAAMDYDVCGCFVDEQGIGKASITHASDEMQTEAGRRRLLAVYAAGYVGEIIGAGRPDDPAIQDEDASELAYRVARLAATTEQREDGRWLKERAHAELARARRSAREILDKQWGDVEAIAGCLH